MQPQQHLVIIGNGIAGITLAQQVRLRSSCSITLISSESATHFSRPALMYLYMGQMRYKDITPYADWYYREQRFKALHDKVLSVSFASKTLYLQHNEPIQYDVLVLATGSYPSFYDWPDYKAIKGVQGLVTLQDLELLESQTAAIDHAVIVGGGLIGIELAEMLRSRGKSVTMLVREKFFWSNNLPDEEAKLVSDHIKAHSIKLLLQEELEGIETDATGHVTAVKTNKGNFIPCQFVGITTGVKPNIALAKDTGIETDTGFLVDEYFNTNIKDVYAIGDCAQFREVVAGLPVVEQLWYTARIHGETLAVTLTGKRTSYKRGILFNSAKFLDLEYQSYGIVPSVLDHIKTGVLYWEHTNRKKAIRILYDKNTEEFVGINLLGIRYRHDLCHYWLEQHYSIHQIMQELTAANFDMEFLRHYEAALVKQYLSVFPDKTLPHKTTWWDLRAKYRLYRDITNRKAAHD